jgi:hypothetical protein
MQTYCAPHLLCRVLARASPYFLCTVSALAARLRASGTARDGLHQPASEHSNTFEVISTVGTLLLAALLAVTPAWAGSSRGFAFAVIGDTPYNIVEEPVFRGMLASLDDETLAFIVHVGDFKGAASPCSDTLFEERRAQFNSSRHALIYTPGDNEWTDCHRASAGGYDPVERLDKLRALFFSGDSSLGRQAMPLERQSADPRFAAYRENQRWRVGRYLFVTLNLPGSNNNLGRSAEADAEHSARMAANRNWLDQAFDLAKSDDTAALFLFFQANPLWEQKPAGRRGYRKFVEQLEAGARRLGKPVIVVHGDTHTFRVDQPLRDSATGKTLENVTRIETYGSPRVGWVRVEIDPESREWLRVEGKRYPPPE